MKSRIRFGSEFIPFGESMEVLVQVLVMIRDALWAF